MNSRFSRSASPTGALPGAPPGQMLLVRSPGKKGARKRHRGGGGLAVPGPFKRIARAGGQKVTIRTAQRALFEISSGLPQLFPNFFRWCRNDRGKQLSWWKYRQIHAVAAELPVEGGAQLF